jgi:pimeloyl-ACP methyl ester carboxylesterase
MGAGLHQDWGSVALLIALALFILIGGAYVVLERNGRAFVARAEKRFPPLGRFIESNEGVRLHVVEAGDAANPRLFLIHGALSNLRDMWDAFRAFETHHHVSAYDRPGLGYSQRAKHAERLLVQAKAAIAALEQTGGGAPALIIAHSLGAATALRVAIERPDLVRGLILLSPASHPYPGGNAWWAHLAATPLIGRAFCATLVPLVGPLMEKSGLDGVFRPEKAPKDYAERIGLALAFRPRAFRANALDVTATKKEFVKQAPLYVDILAPTIIIAADHDKIASTELHARALARELQNAELVIAPGAGHAPHASRPDLVGAALARLEAMARAAAGD